MLDKQIYLGILLLMCVSFLVRIIPAFIDFRFSDETQGNVKQYLPISVFINLIVYCVYQEIQISLYPAIMSIIVIFILYRFTNLLFNIGIATFIYLFLKHNVFI